MRISTTIIAIYALVFALAVGTIMVAKQSLSSKAPTPTVACEGFSYRGAIVCDEGISR